MATKTITQKLVDSMAMPKCDQLILRNSALRGFALRLTPGGKSFIEEARVNGKNKRVTVGRADLLSVENARTEAIRLLALMTTGDDPQLV